jgi:hypothetical protein
VSRHLRIVNVEAVTASAKGVVLVAVAAKDAGVCVQEGEAGAVGPASENAALGGSAAIERLADCKGWVAEDSDAAD